ncbi:MAG: serine/threonine-protein kinase [Polyangiales bacterium]
MRKICLRCGAKFASRAEYCPHDGSRLVTDDEIADPLLGKVLLEQFRIDAQIGTGGMGTVYRARQTTVDRDVAIKVLRPELARDEQAVFRFEREARLAISLDHPNLVRVFLSGRLSDGRLYIVMELLEGRSLADELDEHGPPTLERALIMVMKLCAGLGAVHAAGVVHRDIKPENVYLVRRGRDNDFVKLVDFGIARVLQDGGVGPATTQTGRVFGTATYISPEAATGEETDQRSDIYSLGVLTYQLLTGELPFEGKTAGAVLMQHVHQAPPPLQTKGQGAAVPDALARVVMRSLSKDPGARQQTLAEFLDALSEAAGRAGLLADARAFLLGTIWGDDLAAPGSYLAELLGSSPPPTSPSPFADTQRVAVDRDPDEEALLSSAPRPFGTTSHDLAVTSGPKRRGRGWLWASLGLLTLISLGVVVGTWWSQQSPSATIAVPEVEAVKPAPAAPEEAPALAEVSSDVPLTEPPRVEEAMPDEPVAEVEKVAENEPKVDSPNQTKARRRSRGARTVPKTVAAPVTETVSSSATASETKLALEADDGIDWTVPEFPQEPSAPTGTPKVPARNPIVIDEPPSP